MLHTGLAEKLLLEGKYGAGKRSRTPDLRITNALLYLLSYAGEVTNERLCGRR